MEPHEYAKYTQELYSLSRGSRKNIILICPFCEKLFATTPKNMLSRSYVSCFECVRFAKSYDEKYGTNHEYWLSKHKLPVEFIDIEESKKLFGYGSLNVWSVTNKHIIAKCEFCLSKFETTLSSIHRDQRHVCCSKCGSLVRKYYKQNEVTNKHEYFTKSHLSVRQLFLNKFGVLFGPGSDERVKMTCEFCLNEFDKPIKYIDYKHETIACHNCSSVAACFNQQKLIINKRDYFLSMIPPPLNETLVNVQKTIEKFGYNPTNFRVGNSKRVVCACCYCGVDITACFHYLVKHKFRQSCIKCRKKKNMETMIDKYGVSNALSMSSVQDKLTDPLTERIVGSILQTKYKVEFIRNYSVPFIDGKEYTFDFFVPVANLLIECQGDYFHDFKSNGYSGTARDRSKVTYIENHTNFKLIHIWEHEIHLGRVNEILNYHMYGTVEHEIEIKSKINIQFRKIDDKTAHSFLCQYHYLGNLGIASTCYGAFFDDVLICVGTFGGITRQGTFKKVNKLTGFHTSAKTLKELRRFCVRPNVISDRLAPYCLRAFLELYSQEHLFVEVVVGFSDPTVCDSGLIYKYSGWKSLEDISKSYHYLDPKTLKMIHKKTILKCATNSHMTETAFVASVGLTKVDESSKLMWMKSLC